MPPLTNINNTFGTMTTTPTVMGVPTTTIQTPAPVQMPTQAPTQLASPFTAPTQLIQTPTLPVTQVQPINTQEQQKQQLDQMLATLKGMQSQLPPPSVLEAPESPTTQEKAPEIVSQAPSRYQSPEAAFSDIYQNIYSNLGVNDIQNRYQEISSKYTALQEEKDKELENVLSDPWTSQETREFQRKKIEDRYDRKNQILTNQLALFGDVYKSALSETRFQTQSLMDAYYKQRTIDAGTLEQAQRAAEARNKQITLEEATKYGLPVGTTYGELRGKILKKQEEAGLPAPETRELSDEAQAVIEGTIRLEDLTPTVRGKIAGELTSAGYKSLPKLSAGQQEDVASMKTVNGLIDDVLEFNADGKLEGVGSLYRGSLKSAMAQLGFSSEEGMSVRALFGNIKGTIAKLRGGTSFTPNEEKLLNSYTPSINDNPAVAINKLFLLKDFINRKNTDILSVAKERGVQIEETPKTADLRAKYNY